MNLYTCGPTVYNYAHIGNLRSYIFADLVYRSLKFHKKISGETEKINWVMNITDVDDKTIRNTIAEFGTGANTEDLKKYTDRFYKIFISDLEKVNISVLEKDIKFIKVSDVIPEIQDFIVKLLETGYAYKSEDGSVYFSIEKYQRDFGHYGELVGEKFLEGKKIGARVKVDEYDKDNLSDFALWKARDEKTDGQIFWSHPLLGDGRPGWHIECSAINEIAFGSAGTDIHTGGVDLIFPHHVNETAQSEAYYGLSATQAGKKFVKEWLHSEHILVDGKKMSKSLGNVYTLQDLEEKGFDPLAYRYLLLQTGYKQKVNFTWASLESASKGLQNLRNKIQTLQTSEEVRTSRMREVELPTSPYLQDFSTKIAIFNTASALAILQAVLSDKTLPLDQKLSLVSKFDEVLGLNL